MLSSTAREGYFSVTISACLGARQKFERALFVGNALKGLFLHVELIQPRRRGPGRHSNDIAAPNPGFTAAQYRQLALLYTIASVRAGEWLIPAFYA